MSHAMWEICDTDGSTSTQRHPCHLQSMVYFRVTSGVQPVGVDRCIKSCIHHHSVTQSGFTALNIPCAHLFIPPPLIPGKH